MGNAAHTARKALALACLLSFGLALPAFAESCPSPKEMRVEEVNRAFVQERHIEGMSKPLVSRGELHADADEIVWHMKDPFDVKTIITSDGISESVSGGPLQPVGAGSGELGASVARSAAALMRGQWEELSSLFNVSSPATLDDGDWQVVLTPLNDRMKQAVGDIAVTGCTDVEKIEIGSDEGEGAGERHVITFSAPEEQG